MDNKDFLDFLSKCINKEKEAWDSFVEKYNRLIYNYILKTLKRYNYKILNDEADEIFSRIFLALLEKDCRRLRNFRGQNEQSFCAYIREISFNFSIDFLRKQRHFIEYETIQYYISEEKYYNMVEKNDIKKTIGIFVENLPERQRYLYNLIYEEGVELKKIAKDMNLKLNAIYQLKTRMIKNLVKYAKKKNIYQFAANQ